MIMTQFIDSKTKSSGKLEETRPRTDFGRHRYMETETRPDQTRPDQSRPDQSSPVLDYSPTSQVIVIRYLDIKQK